MFTSPSDTGSEREYRETSHLTNTTIGDNRGDTDISNMTAHHDDAPPEYTPSEQTEYERAPREEYGPTGPSGPNRLRAESPMCIRSTNGAIKSNYSVRLMAPVPEKPDVELRTANGSIQSSLALIGTRPATITATSWNGAVRLRTERQGTVAIEAESKNGAVHLWLPAGFDGIVTASSGNGNVKLTNALMESAVLVPHSGPGQAWRVKAPDSRGGGTGAGGCDGGNGGNGGRKGARAHASIEINMQFGNKASALPAPTPPVPPTPPAPSVVSPTLPKPPVPPSESASTSSIPNPFTPTDDKKSLALAYATADAGREVDDQAQERIPVRAQWERQVGEMGEEIAGPDRAKARTANGNVRIYLADEGEEECSSKCSVM